MTMERFTRRGFAAAAFVAVCFAAGIAVLILAGCTAAFEPGQSGAAPIAAVAEPGVADASAADILVSATESVDRYLTIDGDERSYLVSAPMSRGDTERLPVLVVLHGAGSNARTVEDYTGISALAASNGFLAVYPSGTVAAGIPGELAWNAGVCCGAPVQRDMDDVAFITAVLADVARNYPTDPERVFVTGFSNGGMLSYRLACELGDRVAGIAVVAGSLAFGECAGAPAIPVLIVHGTADATVPFVGGTTNARTAARFGTWVNASVADAAAAWSRTNGCNQAPAGGVAALETGTAAGTAAGTVTAVRYTGCANGAALEVLVIEGGTHVWPTTESTGFDASGRIVDFFGLREAVSSLAQ